MFSAGNDKMRSIRDSPNSTFKIHHSKLINVLFETPMATNLSGS
jgi:hypothetical protein